MIVIEVVEAMAFFGFGYLVGAVLNRKPPVIKQVIDHDYVKSIHIQITAESLANYANERGMVLMPKGFEDIRRGKSKRLP